MSFLDPVHFLMPDLQSSPLTPTGPPSPTLPPIPKLGQTRCCMSYTSSHPSRSPPTDWALLSAELDFLYIDPVLHAHLGPQADTIIGKKLLDFVHPDEHASANQDLGKVLESRTLHGSVTRLAARSLPGAPRSPPPVQRPLLTSGTCTRPPRLHGRAQQVRRRR